MKKALSFLLTLALILTAGLSAAEAKHIRPMEFPEDAYDLNNGGYWFATDPGPWNDASSLTMTLYLEDRYSLAEIEDLEPGDTVEVGGETYTVSMVVIHGWYDSDGDGEYNGLSVTVKDPEKVKDLLEEARMELSEYELVPESYEIYTQEEFDGYITFTVGDDGFCHPLVNDLTLRTKIGTVEVPLPLPESFVYHIVGDDEETLETAEYFLEDEYGYGEFGNFAFLEDGKLVEVWTY